MPATNGTYPKWSEDEIEKFAVHLPVYECIWNKRSPGYRQQDDHVEAWRALGIVMGRTPDDCKNKYQNLRSALVRDLRYHPFGEESPDKKSGWIKRDLFRFMQDHVQPRSRLKEESTATRHSLTMYRGTSEQPRDSGLPEVDSHLTDEEETPSHSSPSSASLEHLKNLLEPVPEIAGSHLTSNSKGVKRPHEDGALDVVIHALAGYTRNRLPHPGCSSGSSAPFEQLEPGRSPKLVKFASNIVARLSEFPEPEQDKLMKQIKTLIIKTELKLYETAEDGEEKTSTCE
ncbi:hypothetical protein BV898_07287 [Hypsibius exemplaris]|uniref:MADF domain-containing protein n=1 Tax=Hypsibius exemplaris TaxID=2072580 RepID=A0A1W0WTX1_HYPEX|nr:hypothetical protein BV898_07287 [Hypsibius exemplaris]